MVEPKPDEYHRRFVGPAEALERSIAAAPNDLSLWIELIVHYWVMTETGVVCALGAPGPLMWQACTRRQQLLAAAKERFGAAPRLLFWTKYLDWLDGAPFSDDDCRAIAARDPDNLEPALYLYAACDDPDAEPGARALFEQVRASEGERAKFLFSVLDSAFHTFGSTEQKSRTD